MSTVQHATTELHVEEERKTIKLLVWDLDNTLWEGTLLREMACASGKDSWRH